MKKIHIQDLEDKKVDNKVSKRDTVEIIVNNMQIHLTL